MEHNEVVESVKNWLKQKYPPPKEVFDGAQVDIIVDTYERLKEKIIIRTHLQVECKKTNDFADQAIGQCLRYYTDFKGLCTYIAIPDDFHQLEDLKNIIEFVELPLGIISVHYDGTIEIIRKAEGHERLEIRKL